MQKNHEESLNEILNNDGHPWAFIEKNTNLIKAFDICPISSLQSDYNDLPYALQNKLKQLCEKEIELFSQLIKTYSDVQNADIFGVMTLLSIKGALQYKKILGEDFYTQMLKTIKEQFYGLVGGK